MKDLKDHRRQGFNFNYILRAAFFVRTCFAFLYLTFVFVIFVPKGNCPKATHKMLVKLIKG